MFSRLKYCVYKSQICSDTLTFSYILSLKSNYTSQRYLHWLELFTDLNIVFITIRGNNHELNMLKRHKALKFL